MTEVVHRYEGTVAQIPGDGIMALFGAPIAHEDHAVRACYAALAMHEAAREIEFDVGLGIRPQIRVGLDSGEVVIGAIGNDLSSRLPRGGLDHAQGRADGADRVALNDALDRRDPPPGPGVGPAARTFDVTLFLGPSENPAHSTYAPMRMSSTLRGQFGVNMETSS